MIRRFADVVVRPRAAMTALVHQPVWLAPWLTILVVCAGTAAWFLRTDVGHQALVDERVRLTEAFGGSVTDTDYAGWLATPPVSVYLTSGGRVLLNPVVTLVAALGLWLGARLEGAAPPSARVCLSLAVHATVVLALGQLVALPLHYVRESLTSPFTLATVVPGPEDGSLTARWLGGIDLFVLWWTVLLGIGLSVLTGRPVGRYLWPAALVLGAGAGLLVGLIAALGGVV